MATPTPNAHVHHKGCCDILSSAGKVIGNNPSNERTVLKGIAAVIEGLGLFIKHTETTLAFLKNVKFADKTIKSLKGLSLISFWHGYRFRSPVVTIRDIADTIVVAFAPLQLLDSAKIISFAGIGESMGKVPVLGAVTKVPLGAFLGGLELIVSAIFMFESGKKIYNVKSGNNEVKYQKWLNQQNNIGDNLLNRDQLRAKWAKKHSSIFKTVHFNNDAPAANEARCERGIFFKTIYKTKTDAEVDGYVRSEVNKWDNKAHHRANDIVHMETANFLLHAVLATLAVLTILSACALTFVGIGVVMTILGITATVIGVYVLIHDILNPKDQWGTKIQVNDLT